MESSSVVKRLPMPFAESIGESDLVSEKSLYVFVIERLDSFGTGN